MQNRSFIATMIINGEKMPAFSGNTLVMPKSQEVHTAEIIEYARANFTRPRAEVEDVIRKAAESTPLAKGQTPAPTAQPQPHSDISVGGGILGASGVNVSHNTALDQNTHPGPSEEPKKKKRTRSRRKKKNNDDQ